jgi:TonB family protein
MKCLKNILCSSLAAAGILLPSLPTIAQQAPTKSDIQKCGKIDDDLSRLACFDALSARVQGAPSVSPPVNGTGLWKVSTERSAIDDSTSVTALLTASQPIGIGYRQASPTAVARCKEGNLDFYIVWDVFIGSGKHQVTMRLDSDNARVDTWSVSTDHKATFYSGDRVALFEALTKAKKLVVRTTPFGESPVITSFNISGFANVSPTIFKGCASIDTGTAAQAAGPSASYGGRIAARIRPNITFLGDMAGIIGDPGAEVEVRAAADGTITSRKLLKSSGIKAWDEAVLKAIDKTEILPLDTDGRVPSELVISFRPKD